MNKYLSCAGKEVSGGKGQGGHRSESTLLNTVKAGSGSHSLSIRSSILHRSCNSINAFCFTYSKHYHFLKYTILFFKIFLMLLGFGLC